MAMLAEPRQRKRYNLVPKGKALYEDSDRFGTKMLEKMGWSKGKGLGSREDGQQEFVRVRYKNDVNGMGFEERDDQWTEHEKHFNGLLDSLNGVEATTNSAGDVEAPTVGFGFKAKSSTKEKLTEKFSGQSLEEKSKNSKARVHYKKFTKGKDMSQYSEKDLANIFGKKEPKEEDNIYSQFQAYNAYDDDNQEDNIINTGVSVSDYFKVKMEALQQKKGLANGSNEATQEETPSKKNKKSKKKPSDGEEVAKDENEATKEEKTPEEFGKQIFNTGVSVNDYFKMKMEALKRKKEAATVSEPIEEETPVKKKKSKKQTDDVDIDESTVASEETIEEVPLKKKKSEKQVTEENSIEIEPEIVSEEPSSKKNKKKNKSLGAIESSIVDSTSASESTVDEIPLIKEKSKKQVTEENSIEIEPEIVSEEPSSKKNKKKNKSLGAIESSIVDSTSASESTVDEIPLIKKKSKKQVTEENSIEVEPEIVSEEPSSKKNKSLGAIESSIVDSTSASESTVDEIPLIKKKSKKRPIEDANTGNDSSTTTIPTQDTINVPKKKNKSQPIEDASSRTTDSSADNIPSKKSKKNKSPPTEKFRNIELARYNGSSISDIIGYGFSENLDLKIITIENDQKRIMQFWNGFTDKYALHSTPKKKIYRNYRKKVRQAWKEKKRTPKIKTKSLKRKNVFQCL